MSYRGNIDGHLLHRWQRSRIHRIDVFRSSDSGADPSAPKVARTCALQRFFVARNRSSRFRTSAHGARPTVSGLIGNRAPPHGNAPVAPLARSPTGGSGALASDLSQPRRVVIVQFTVRHLAASASAIRRPPRLRIADGDAAGVTLGAGSRLPSRVHPFAQQVCRPRRVKSCGPLKAVFRPSVSSTPNPTTSRDAGVLNGLLYEVAAHHVPPSALLPRGNR